MKVYDLYLQVKCFDWDADSSHDLIGQFTTTLTELTADGSANVSAIFIEPLLIFNSPPPQTSPTLTLTDS